MQAEKCKATSIYIQATLITVSLLQVKWECRVYDSVQLSCPAVDINGFDIFRGLDTITERRKTWWNFGFKKVKALG